MPSPPPSAASTRRSSPSTRAAARIEARAQTLGLPLQDALDAGLLRFQQIDPAELSPGEFAANVRHSVEVDGARVVVIDSLNGYLNAMPDERFLILQMHELLSYLGQQGVLTILVLAQHGLVGPMDTPLDISYLSDAVLMLRYFEVERHGPARPVGGQEAQRQSRAHDPRVPARHGRHHAGAAADATSAASSPGTPRIRRRQRAADGRR